MRVILIGAILTGLLPGCHGDGGGSATADVRYRIFETPKDVADKIVPKAKRARVDNSTYWLARVTPTELDALLAGVSPKLGVLADSTRSVSWWPRVAESCSYSKADGEFLGGGGFAGFLGVRNLDGRREVRVEGQAQHTINTREGLSSEFVYEGPAFDGEALVFIRPFTRTDGAELAHVIAFEVWNWK